MIRLPPRSTLSSSSAASDVYKRQGINAEYMGKNPRLVSINRDNQLSSYALSKEIVKQLGVKGLYNGMPFQLFGCALSNSIYFYSEEFIKETLKLNQFKVWKQAQIQYFAALCNIFITAPIWTVNTKMNLSQENKTFLQTMHGIVKNNGFFALYNGVPASLFLSFNPMISHTLFHAIQEKSNHRMPTLASGAISKIVATLLTFPYLVIRTNLQNKSHDKSNFDVIKEIYQVKGVHGFLSGMSVKFVESVLNQAFMLFFHDKLTKKFKEVIFKEKKY
eukprot:TRINITY_DN49813_c0_g1_i1.p1 TRINITY_DN49813_c0_g1~~TRINITY_DN49813_c0_g1_i1.p1  ORF type:complete len:276 (+),score=47.56 TRINITY_DN49813_c0_g1_i1:104-931(+)